jgi:pimeloyl-ACP methyl ester carboxylesterase
MAKKTLLIIPGWGGTCETWKNFMDLSQNEFETVCFNLPGFGDEPCPQVPWGVEDYAEFVKNKMKSAGIKRPYILGHSFGGQVAAFLAANHPDMADKLILSGAAALRPKQGFTKKLFSFLARTGEIIFKLPVIEKADIWMKKMFYYFSTANDYAGTSEVKKEIFKKISRQDLTHLLPKINVPTLVVWGTQDAYMPLASGRKIATLIPGAKLEVIEGGKHGLHIQQPENFLKIIKEFLD